MVPMDSQPNYYLVRIQPNPNSSIEPSERQKLGKGHHQFIDSLVEDGVIVIGGPIEGKPGGMIIARGTNLDSVKETFDKDPMVTAGGLSIEVNAWRIKHGDPSILG